MAAFGTSDQFKDLAQGTQYHYSSAIARLTRVFGACRYEQIGEAELAQYVKRSTTKTLAKRDVACLSSCWSWALTEGRTTIANPRFGLEFKKRKADRKALHAPSDADFLAVRNVGDPILQDALDLLYLSGQDVRVVLSWRREQIRDGHLETGQTKTGVPIRIAVTGEFASVIQRKREKVQPLK